MGFPLFTRLIACRYRGRGGRWGGGGGWGGGRRKEGGGGGSIGGTPQSEISLLQLGGEGGGGCLYAAFLTHFLLPLEGKIRESLLLTRLLPLSQPPLIHSVSMYGKSQGRGLPTDLKPSKLGRQAGATTMHRKLD